MKKQALGPNDWPLIKNYLMGGAAIGGSAALITSLLNHLNEIKSENENPLDKDTLKLIVKSPKKEEKEKVAMASGAKKPDESASFLRGPLAIVGALLAAGGTYGLVRDLHQKIKQRKLEKELDDVQNSYVGNLENSPTTKIANDNKKSMGTMEMLTSAPLAAAMLLALGSGVVSYNTLKNQYPDMKTGTRLGPKRVRVVAGDNNNSDSEIIDVPDAAKMAAANAFLVNTVAAMGNSDISRAVFAVANGYGRHFENEIVLNGINSAFEKTASVAELATTKANAVLASNWLVNSELAAPSITLIAASEFADKAPFFFKAASALSPKIQNLLIELVADYNAKIATGIGAAAGVVDHVSPDKVDHDITGAKHPHSNEKADVQELLDLLMQHTNATPQEGDTQTQESENLLDPTTEGNATSDQLAEDELADLQTSDSEESGQDAGVNKQTQNVDK